MKCIKCKSTINRQRIKALPNTKVCVNCSTTNAYRAVSTVNGTGDHTWNDIQIVTAEQAEQLDNQKKPKLLDSYSSVK